jgi:methyl-accepting chemotaxis protein
VSNSDHSATTSTHDERSTEELRSHMNAIDRVMATVEFDTSGIFVRANDLFFEAMGYTPAELQGAHHRLFVSEADSKAAG